MSESERDVEAVYDAEAERRLHAEHPELVASMKESWAHPELRVARPERPVRD